MAILKPTTVVFPEVLSLALERRAGQIAQLSASETRVEGHFATYASKGAKGFVFQPSGGDPSVLILSGGKTVPTTEERVLLSPVDPTPEVVDLSSASGGRYFVL